MCWFMTAGRGIIGMANMKTALVTGDLGFIGQHLCRALSANEEYEVFGLDVKRGWGEDIRGCGLPAVDVCFHLAAQTNAHSADAWEDAGVNIMGTVRILERYRERVVFAASATNPVVPYAISKHACEHYCQLYGARIVRMCNITGPGGHGVFEAFAKADILKIAGKGDQKRAYAPVHRAIAMFLEAATAPPGTLFTLQGPELTVLEIADLFYPTKPREFIEQNKNDVTDPTYTTP